VESAFEQPGTVGDLGDQYVESHGKFSLPREYLDHPGFNTEIYRAGIGTH
jgi:hypothetical protein